MNTFKRKALAAAVLAGLGATGAEAVYRNQDQTGQVLIYPYYTVNTIWGNSYNTYFSITNTTADAKVLKVRFREGKTSAEVLDFNLYLSPNDMWVGAIVPQSTSDTAPAMILAGGDLSCTDPAFPTAGEPFKNFVYASGTDSLPGTGLERTREGYVEVFEMASLSGTAAANVTHTGLGLPPLNCAAMRSTDGVTAPASLLVAGNTLAPTGGLYGQGTLINVGNGSDMGYVADALDLYAVTAYYFGVGTASPTLGGAQVAGAPSSILIANGIAYSEDFAAGVSLGSAGARAVASVFMHSSVLNDYILDTGTRSNTDWVLTFPIKREFVNATTAGDPFSAVVTTAGACEAASFTFFNRDEQSTIPPAGGFSPPGPGSGGAGSGNLCWESTVVSIRNGVAHTTDSDVSATDRRSGVLGSRNVVAVTVLSSFQNGWMNLTFTGAGATGATRGLTTAAGTSMDQAGATILTTQTFVGLPVTGFMVRTFTNDAIDCTRNGAVVVGGCQGNYGSLFNHAYRTTVR